MKKSIAKVLALTSFTALALAACAKAAPASSETGGEGGEGGAEAALVTYTDAAQSFSIGYPSPWSQDPSMTEGVKFVGGDDWMTLTFKSPAPGTDVMAYAQNQVPEVAAAFPEFKQISLQASSEVQGAVVLGFNADGTSVVTGKAYTAHDEIYYIPLADGRIAVLTVAGPENHYDREGVRDIALTLKVSN